MADASCDSSSSEDEDRDKFAEIVKSVHLGKRHWRRDEETNSITPEFQKHVAKKLAAFLDSSVQMTDVREPDNHGGPQESGEGIKLLSSAKQTLKTATNENKKSSKMKRPPKTYSSGSSEDEEETRRLAEAAVSGYSIIANGNEDVTRAKTETSTADKDQSKHKKKNIKEKKEQKKCKSEKKKKRY